MRFQASRLCHCCRCLPQSPLRTRFARGERVIGRGHIQEEILLNMEVELREGLCAREQIYALGRFERTIRSRFPSVKRILIAPARPSSGYG
jgi:hypothetical protein